MPFIIHRLTHVGPLAEEVATATETLARLAELTANGEAYYVVCDRIDLEPRDVEAMARAERSATCH